MRVIAGRLRGRLLRTPDARARDAEPMRPSSQRTRTALFDALGARVSGARVLDLYAGAGSLGIEALSRGAAHAVFVERSRAALVALQHNLRDLELAACSRVLSEEVESALERLRREGVRFDLVLMDPPYRAAGAEPGDPGAGTRGPGAGTRGRERRIKKGRERGRGGEAGRAGGAPQGALAALAEPGACLIAERSRRDGAWVIEGWDLQGSRVYGETRVDRYERGGSDPGDSGTEGSGAEDSGHGGEGDQDE
jgi:16S rRNA G966 N2-methylase RsmD